MARDTQSEKDQVTYRTYDNRAISRDSIQDAFRLLESKQRNRERWEKIRGWVLATIVLIALMVVFVALVWWRLSSWT
ncbi:MAG: hypothetical protein NVS2B16_01190 [Chloroflexota bacterium]